jgi:hypothetical protein
MSQLLLSSHCLVSRLLTGTALAPVCTGLARQLYSTGVQSQQPTRTAEVCFMVELMCFLVTGWQQHDIAGCSCAVQALLRIPQFATWRAGWPFESRGNSGPRPEPSSRALPQCARCKGGVRPTLIDCDCLTHHHTGNTATNILPFTGHACEPWHDKASRCLSLRITLQMTWPAWRCAAGVRPPTSA